MSFRPAALVLGLSIAFIEIGTIFIYKAGWTMNASFIVTNALITLCLILTGAVLYGESCPAGRHWESLFLLSAYAASCGERDRAEGCVNTFICFYGNAYGRWKRTAERQSGSPVDNI